MTGLIPEIKKLTATTKLVYVYLLSWGIPIQTNDEALGESLGVNPFTITKCRRTLVKMGYLRVSHIDGKKYVWEIVDPELQKIKKMKEML